MNKLEIPDAVKRHACEVYDGALLRDEGGDHYDSTPALDSHAEIEALVAVAPAIVAEELRRHAYRLYQRSDNTLMARDGSGRERVATLRQIGDELLARADELDGGVR